MFRTFHMLAKLNIWHNTRIFSVQQNMHWHCAAGMPQVWVLEPPNTVIFLSWTEYSGYEIKYQNILLVTETSQHGWMYFGRIFWSEVFARMSTKTVFGESLKSEFTNIGKLLYGSINEWHPHPDCHKTPGFGGAAVVLCEAFCIEFIQLIFFSRW